MVQTEVLDVDAGGRIFKLKAVKDIDSLLNLVQNDDDVPFWAVLWPAAIGMARFLWQGPNLSGSRVLELGAGLGLAGIVAAAKGGRVCQTDFIPEALEFCKFNAALNKMVIDDRPLADWRQFNLQGSFDLILGSDILYEPTLHPYLHKIFSNYLNPGGRIVLSDPGREDAKNFINQLVKEGFRVSCDKFDIKDGELNYCVRVYTLTN